MRLSESRTATFWRGDLSGWKPILLLAALISVAYAPALNNGFIADDYIFLRRIEDWKDNPLYLFSLPPEQFRLTTYACFLLLKNCFGYHAEFFYAFTILLHLANTLLFWKCLRIVSDNVEIAAVGSVLFATVQNPQEAIFWLAGMNEALLAACVLAALLLWAKEHYAWAGLLYVAALFCKESAVLLLLLLPLWDFCLSRKIAFRRGYAYLLVPTSLFLVEYLHTVSSNVLLTPQLYAFRPQAVLVLVNSVHRLLFPWAYASFILVLVTRGWRTLSVSVPPLAWLLVSLLPYIFLTYQSHVPSRHQYVASLGFAWLLASLTGKVPSAPLRRWFLTAFVIVNTGYLWLVKDAQFVQRAAPTNALLHELRGRPPQNLLVMNFPLNPWIAKNTTFLVPGWRQEFIHVNETEEACPGCLRLLWDPGSHRYTTQPPHRTF